ncbi:MAG: ribonuclease HI [Clostridiales Family XIII bacterium]|jgi:ribonuclease HI|nr:ribonuclease HI [Clostridiales Family XIII bacterium]
MSEKNFVNIYTDGACSNNQKDENIGGWGAILEFGEHRKELYGGETNTTNNRMEMTALLASLQALKKPGLKLNIFSDSSYLVNCFRMKWYVKWKANNWMRTAKEPVLNREIWTQLLDCAEAHKLSFYLVKGHINVKGAEKTLRAAFEKFQKHNGEIFDYERFLYITEMNNRADALANQGISDIRMGSTTRPQSL